MSVVTKLNGVVVYPVSVFPSEKGDRDWNKYTKIYEPSQVPGHKGRELIVRKDKLTIEKRNSYGQHQEGQEG